MTLTYYGLKMLKNIAFLPSLALLSGFLRILCFKRPKTGEKGCISLHSGKTFWSNLVASLRATRQSSTNSLCGAKEARQFVCGVSKSLTLAPEEGGCRVWWTMPNTHLREASQQNNPSAKKGRGVGFCGPAAMFSLT